MKMNRIKEIESLLEQKDSEIDNLLVEIDELKDRINEQAEEIDTLNENIREFYRPVDPYEYNGVSRSDFH